MKDLTIFIYIFFELNIMHEEDLVLVFVCVFLCVCVCVCVCMVVCVCVCVCFGCVKVSRQLIDEIQ